MTIAVANNMADYMSDAAHTDGILFLHMTPEDASILEELCIKYKKETRRFREKEDLTYIEENTIMEESEEEPVIDEKPKKVVKAEKTAKKAARAEKKKAKEELVPEKEEKKTRAKSIWIHKRKQEKRIPEKDLDQYTSDGWKIGKANK